MKGRYTILNRSESAVQSIDLLIVIHVYLITRLVDDEIGYGCRWIGDRYPPYCSRKAPLTA